MIQICCLKQMTFLCCDASTAETTPLILLADIRVLSANGPNCITDVPPTIMLPVTVIPVPEPTREQYIAQAETHKQFLLEESRQKITFWQTKLLMGRKLTDTESASLNAWIDYIDAVTAIDTSTAPDINWPVPPEV